MTKDAIPAQIEAMPEGSQRDLAQYMNSIYENEYNEGWAAVSPTYDFLNAPIWTPEPGQFGYSDAAAITEDQHDRLAVLREQAGGWFYLKDGNLIFVTLEEWEQQKAGQPEP